MTCSLLNSRKAVFIVKNVAQIFCVCIHLIIILINTEMPFSIVTLCQKLVSTKSQLLFNIGTKQSSKRLL